MAVDKNKAKDLVNDIQNAFDAIVGFMPSGAKESLRSVVFGQAFEEIRKTICDARPPVILLFGRSGHGKSSVVNALVGKKIAEVGQVAPETAESIRYEVSFPDRYATWSIIDTRGIFESTRPEGASPESSVDVLLRDINRYKPDVLLHTVCAAEVRALSDDISVFRKIQSQVKKIDGLQTITFFALTKVDNLGRPGSWPPEANAQLAGEIMNRIDYLANDVLNIESGVALNANTRMRGIKTADSTYRAIIPVCTYEDEGANCYWNIETLIDFICRHLPKEAQLNFSQALKRKEHLRRISSRLIKQFSVIAGAVGASPIPVSDMIVLTPLQLLMIAVIGGLSCREISKETAFQYLSAAGLDVPAGYGLRTAAQQLTKLIPGAGSAISSAIAGGGTYAIGKSAEAYFFSDEFKGPDEFHGEWDGNVEPAPSE